MLTNGPVGSPFSNSNGCMLLLYTCVLFSINTIIIYIQTDACSAVIFYRCRQCETFFFEIKENYVNCAMCFLVVKD